MIGFQTGCWEIAGARGLIIDTGQEMGEDEFAVGFDARRVPPAAGNERDLGPVGVVGKGCRDHERRRTEGKMRDMEQEVGGVEI